MALHYSRVRNTFITSLALLGCAPGCGNDGLSSSLEGIWQIDEWTENDANCNAEGPSVLDQKNDKMLAIQAQSFFGTEFLSATPCVNSSDCEGILAEPDTINLSGFIFETGSDSAGWAGTTIAAGSGLDDMCSGSVTEYIMRVNGADGLVIRSERREAQPFAPDSEGFCTTEDAQVAAEGEPCATRSDLSASRL